MMRSFPPSPYQRRCCFLLAAAVVSVVAVDTASAQTKAATKAPTHAAPSSAAKPASAPTTARTSPGDPYRLAAPLPIDPAVRIGTLSNGLRYYVRRNARPEKRAELRLVVNAGSVLEENDQRGLAHFIEHMAFNGTSHFARNDVVKYLESIGVRFGADLNAQTSFDETIYILPVPTDSAGILEKSFQFLSDIASAVTFDSTEVVAERGVVLEEWRGRLGAGERTLDKELPVLLGGSRYAERIPIGLPTIIESANPAPLKRFWTDWYRPDLMSVIAVGDVEPTRLEALIRQAFGNLRKPVLTRPRIEARVPFTDSTRVSIVTDKELTTSQLSVRWQKAATIDRTVGDYRRSLIEQLQDQMLNQRLNELSQRSEAPFVGAGTGRGNFVRPIDIYLLSATPKEGKVIDALRALLTESERARQHGFLRSELERARIDMLRNYERAYDEREKTVSSSFVEEYINHYLTGEAIPGISFEAEAVKRLLPTVTLAEVNAVAQAKRGSANRIIMVEVPDKAGLTVPTDAEVRSVFTQVSGSVVAAYSESLDAGALVPVTPTRGSIVSERAVPEIGVTEWMLSNGVRVIVKPTDFKADELVFRAWSPGGSSLLPDADVLRGLVAAQAIARGGLGGYSLIDLNKKLTGKVARAAAFIGETNQGLQGSASPKDLEMLMQLIWLRITSPRVDTTAFQAMLQQYTAQLQNSGADPEHVFSDTVTVTLAQGNPRVQPMTEDRLKELDLSRMAQIYRERLGDASEMTFLFVGTVDLAVLRPLAEQWLAALPASGRKETFRDVGPTLFTGTLDRVVHKGLAPQSSTLIFLAGTTPWTREQGYVIGSLGELLEMRLLDRLREAMGGTYSVSVGGSISRRPREEWQVAIQYGSAPERADSLYKAVLQEMDSLRRVPASDAEVERVREQQRRELEVQRKQNGYWAGALQGRYEFGDDPRTLQQSDSLIASLTAEKLLAAAKKYLDTTNLARFVLLPESAPIKP